MRQRSVIIRRACRVAAGARACFHPAAFGEDDRVGIVTQTATDKDDPRFDAFRERLHDLGYVEGRNIILDFRFTAGDISRSRQLAAELVALPVDVLVPEGGA